MKKQLIIFIFLFTCIHLVAQEKTKKDTLDIKGIWKRCGNSDYTNCSGFFTFKRNGRYTCVDSTVKLPKKYKGKYNLEFNTHLHGFGNHSILFLYGIIEWINRNEFYLKPIPSRVMGDNGNHVGGGYYFKRIK